MNPRLCSKTTDKLIVALNGIGQMANLKEVLIT